MSDAAKKIAGRLTKDRFGASMPVDAPYFQAPPFYYRDVEQLSIVFDTDADAAADLLPEGLSVGERARAVFSSVWYPRSTFGPYREAILGVPCALEGTDYLYIAQIVVDSVPPLVGGREIWGYPKKLAAVTLADEQELLRATVERPSEVRLVTATLRRERPVENPAPGLPTLSLRVIPSPEPDAPPSLADLVAVQTTERKVHESFSGPATLSFDAASALDPWHALPVRRVLGGSFLRYDFTLPHGRIVRQY